MFAFVKRRLASAEGLITVEQAMSVINAEATKRGWDGYDRRQTRLEQRDGRVVWACFGMRGYSRGGAMSIEVDARTGEVVRAVAGGR